MIRLHESTDSNVPQMVPPDGKYQMVSKRAYEVKVAFSVPRLRFKTKTFPRIKRFNVPKTCEAMLSNSPLRV